MIDWKIVTYVTEQRFKKWVRRAVGGYVLLALGLGYAIWGINNDRGQRRVELAKDNAVQISAVRAAAVVTTAPRTPIPEVAPKYAE